MYVAGKCLIWLVIWRTLMLRNYWYWWKTGDVINCCKHLLIPVKHTSTLEVFRQKRDSFIKEKIAFWPFFFHDCIDFLRLVRNLVEFRIIPLQTLKRKLLVPTNTLWHRKRNVLEGVYHFKGIYWRVMFLNWVTG